VWFAAVVVFAVVESLHFELPTFLDPGGAAGVAPGLFPGRGSAQLAGLERARVAVL